MATAPKPQPYPTDHVIFALQKLGHKDLADSLASLKTDIDNLDWACELTITLKSDDLKIGISIKPFTPQQSRPLLDNLD